MPDIRQCPICGIRQAVSRPSSSMFLPERFDARAEPGRLHILVCDGCAARKRRDIAVLMEALGINPRAAEAVYEELTNPAGLGPSPFAPAPPRTFFPSQEQQRFQRLMREGRPVPPVHRPHAADVVDDDTAIHAELNRWQATDGWKAPR